MRELEAKLLQEIRKQFSPALMEDIHDYSFAIIELEIPKAEHAEYETYVHIYGDKQATIRGLGGVRKTEMDLWVDRTTGQREEVTKNTIKAPKQPMPNPERLTVKQEVCPMCGGREKLTIGDAIKYHIANVGKDIKGAGDYDEFDYRVGLEAQARDATGKKKQNLENTISALYDDIDYLEDAFTRYDNSGKAEEIVDCPLCTGWEWADLSKRDMKRKSPWEIFMDWLWQTFDDAGLNPTKGSGFAGKKDIYGVSKKEIEMPIEKGPAMGAQRGIHPYKEVMIIIESLGETALDAHRELEEIFNAAMKEKPSFFKIEPFPTSEMRNNFDMMVASHRLSAKEKEQADKTEEWLLSNMAFYVTARVKESRYGEEIGLPEYEITTPLDISKLLDKIKMKDRNVKIFRCQHGHEWEIDNSVWKVMVDYMKKTKQLSAAKEKGNEERASKVAGEMNIIWNKLDKTAQKRVSEWVKTNIKDMNVLPCQSCAEAGIANDDNPVLGYEVTIPISVGEVPPRKGEWYKMALAVKKPGAALRSGRSAKAHRTHISTKDEMRDYIRQGKNLAQVQQILTREMEKRAAASGRTATDEMITKYNDTIARVYGEIEKEEEIRRAEEAAAHYPGSKYVHWDNEIDELAEALGTNPVAVELAITKYMDSLDEFPQPFDFDRLSTDAAVRALNILKTISPEDIDSLIGEAVGYLDNLSSEKLSLLELKARSMVADLGCTRANSIYSTLKTMKEDILKPMTIDPLYRESHKFSREYNKAHKMFSSLLKCATPITKVANVVPIIENCSVFDPSKQEFWDNIFGNYVNIDPIISFNSNELARFYRDKVNKSAMSEIKRIYENGGSPGTMANRLNYLVSGRNGNI